MKKSVVSFPLSLLLDIIIVSGLVFIGNLIKNNININFNSVTIILFICTVLLILFNTIYNKIQDKKYNSMTNEDSLNFTIKKKEWVNNNILKLRDITIKQYKLALVYSLFNFIVILLTFISSIITLDINSFNLNFIIFIILLVLVMIIVYVMIYDKLDSLFDEDKRIENYEFIELKTFINNIFKEENYFYDVDVEIYNEVNCSITYNKNKIKVYVGWLLLKALTNEELKSVILHEVAHYHNQDLEYGKKVIKIISKIYIIVPRFLYKLMCPFLAAIEFHNEGGRLLASEYYENKADDVVLQKNQSQDYINAVTKIFGLKLMNEINFLDIAYKVNEDQKWTEESIKLDYQCRINAYNKHIDFIEKVSFNHLHERFATHPNIKERREKFNIEKVNLNIIENNNFNNDIIKYYDRNNEYCFSEESSKQYLEDYKKYVDLKEKVDEYNTESLIDLLSKAYDFGDYETAKNFAHKILLINKEQTRANFILGAILLTVDFSEEGIKYLKVVLAQDGCEYQFDALHILGQYYTFIGNEEELEKIRNIQVRVMDSTDAYQELIKINPKDELEEYNDYEVRAKIIEIVKEVKDIKYVLAGVKKVKELTCCHIIVFFGQLKDKDEFYDALANIFAYLDLRDEQFNLLKYHTSVLETNKKLFKDELIIYNFKNKRG